MGIGRYLEALKFKLYRRRSRFPEGEKAIMSDPFWSREYTKNVMEKEVGNE